MIPLLRSHAARIARQSVAMPQRTISWRQQALYSTEGSGMSEGEQLIHDKLTKALSPHKLRVVDVSGGCGSMYAIDIASAAFKGTSMVKQHRMVNEILKEEIKGMHGLQLKTSAK